MAKHPIRGIPAMGQAGEATPFEFRPGEMKQGATIGIQPAAWNTGRVDECGALTVAQEGLTQAGATFELMVHVAEHHQIRTAPFADAIECQGQILIPPIHSWLLPIPSTGTVGIRAQPGRSAVGHHNQWVLLWNLRGRRHDPLDGRLQIDRPIDRFNRLGEMKSSTGTAGSCPDHRAGQMVPGTPIPGTVVVAKQGELLAQNTTGAIASTIVIAEDHRLGDGQGSDAPREPEITVAEVADEEGEIGLKNRQQPFVGVAPGTMQISGDGNAQVRQIAGLIWIHPARLRF